MNPNAPSDEPARGWHPYRVTRRHDRCARPLTGPQRDVLEALVHLCPTSGSDACPRAVSKAIGLRYGSTVLTLRNLEKQRLAKEHREACDEDCARWSPTLIGRARVRNRRRRSGGPPPVSQPA